MKLLHFFRYAALVLGVACISVTWTATFTDCKGAQSPSPDVLEAGEPVVQSVCSFIAVQTGSTILETICADTPEIALIVATIMQMRADSGAPMAAEVCQTIPTTTVCATPRELHAGIAAVVARRRAMLLRDAGLQ